MSNVILSLVVSSHDLRIYPFTEARSAKEKLAQVLHPQIFTSTGIRQHIRYRQSCEACPRPDRGAGIQKMLTELRLSAMISENRIYSRVKFRWPAMIFTEGKDIEGITRNISVNGAFIYYHQPHAQGIPLPLNQRVATVIRIPERLPLLLQAEVVWSDFLSSDEENTLLGVGLRFIDIFYEDRQYLREAVAEHCREKE